ncbi:MAG: DUF4173 domain-containing protein [Clostridia bacterium]|nr:DUF4173 domain-containing protein [Clostridia bacterium]
MSEQQPTPTKTTYQSPAQPQFPSSPPAPPYGQAVYQAPPKIRKPSDRRDLITAGVLAVLAVLTVNFSLYGGFSIGFVAGYLAMLLCGGLYLRRHLERITPYGLFCLVAAVAAGGTFIWHNDPFAKFVGVIGISLLVALALLSATGIGRQDGGTLAVLRDVWHIQLAAPLTHMGTAVSAIFLVKKGDTIEKRRCGGALLGLLCALPVLVVVVPLLISADAAFEGLLQHTILDNLGEMVISLLVGIPLFCLLYSRVFGLRYGLDKKEPSPTAKGKGVSAMSLNTFLGTISGVYVIYLFSQTAYFFSAFAGILPKDYTVAQYARRGFFEMCAICAINLVLVAICLWLSRKQEGKAPLSTRLLGLFVLVFSIGLVATALSKMGLYITSFGMTRLRILTAVFMVMLGVVLVLVIIRLFANRFPYMKAAVVTVTLIGLLVGYVDVDTFIAHYNVTAYNEEQLEELDLDTLSLLSDGATPYLIELWDNRTPENTQQLARILYQRLEAYGDVRYEDDKYVFTMTETMDFRHYNVDRFRAYTLLADRAQEICNTQLNIDSGYYDENYYDENYYDEDYYERY